MDEIRIIGPGKIRGYPYPVCKKKWEINTVTIATVLPVLSYKQAESLSVDPVKISGFLISSFFIYYYQINVCLFGAFCIRC